MRILIITVGGSCPPIVRAILDHQPDRVYFLCTATTKGSSRVVDGEGPVCGNPRACLTCGEPLMRTGNGTICHKCGAIVHEDAYLSIVAQTGLAAAHYEKVQIDLEDVDNLAACYRSAQKAFDAALAHKDTEVIVDYTGGSKTMSAALVRAATGRYADRVAALSVVTGPRDQLRTVINGAEMTVGQESSFVLLDDQWHQALDLANAYQYAAATAVLADVVRRPTSVASAIGAKAQALSVICRGFDAWDRFDHGEAQRLLRSQARILAGSVVGDCSKLASVARAGYMPGSWGSASVLPVIDLYLNAERRAAQGRYDDAVARLYRSLELLAQNRLKGMYGIDTAKVDPALVTEWLCAQPERSGRAVIQTGLRDDYTILASKGDALALLWQEDGNSVWAMLERRNASILAHGTRPIGRIEYAELARPVWTFLDRAVTVTRLTMQIPAQFPQLTADRFTN